MRAYVAHWDVADETFEHQKFLELFEDLLCQMGDRFLLNIHFFKSTTWVAKSSIRVKSCSAVTTFIPSCIAAFSNGPFAA